MITQLTSRVVYENRWMRVREDDVQFPNGAKGIYGVVEKPNFVVVIPRHEDGRFELVEQYRYPVQGRFWEFPQGAWETRPDAELVDVAHGELAEETGLRAGQMTSLGRLHQGSGFSTQEYEVFLATELTRGKVARDAEEQDMQTGTFSFAETKSMIASGQIRDQSALAALGLYLMAGEFE